MDSLGYLGHRFPIGKLDVNNQIPDTGKSAAITMARSSSIQVQVYPQIGAGCLAIPDTGKSMATESEYLSGSLVRV